MMADIKILGIITILVVFFSVNIVYASCTKDEQAVLTGAACSIAELNKMQKTDISDKSRENEFIQRDLRPINTHQETLKTNDNSCFWGQCLIKQVLYK